MRYRELSILITDKTKLHLSGYYLSFQSVTPYRDIESLNRTLDSLHVCEQAPRFREYFIDSLDSNTFQSKISMFLIVRILPDGSMCKCMRACVRMCITYVCTFDSQVATPSRGP